jgi:hypothetical protein
MLVVYERSGQKKNANSLVGKLRTSPDGKDVQEAKERLASYMKVVIRIFERIEREREQG